MSEPDKEVDEEQTSLIEYPCEFPIKIMGLAQSGFAQQITAIVQRHAPDFDPSTLEMRRSREGNYLGLTATINATSREMLDALYQDLGDHPMVKMVL